MIGLSKNTELKNKGLPASSAVRPALREASAVVISYLAPEPESRTGSGQLTLMF